MFWIDLKHTLKHPGFWAYCALIDTSIKFRNNRMGFMWIFISNLIFVIILSGLYHAMMDVPLMDYALHLYFGITIWNFLNHTITQSSSIIESQRNYLGSPNISFIDLVFRSFVQNLIIFGHNFILVLICAFFVKSLSGYAWVIPMLLGLSLLGVVVILISIFCVLLSATLPDTKEILNAVFRVGFLATPIIWMVDKVTAIDSSKNIIRYYVEFNPFYHMIEVVRGPVLGTDFVYSMYVVFGMILALFTINSIIYTHQTKLMEMSY